MLFHQMPDYSILRFPPPKFLLCPFYLIPVDPAKQEKKTNDSWCPGQEKK
jgi:hypothetical protein